MDQRRQKDIPDLVSQGQKPIPTPHDVAEAKRLDARKRLLIGGVAALPLIVTVGRRQAYAFGASVCASLLLQGVDLDFENEGSLVCELD